MAIPEEINKLSYNERAENIIQLRLEIESKEKEITRLKGLIEKMYWKMFQHHLAVPDNFQQFKTENEL